MPIEIQIEKVKRLDLDTTEPLTDASTPMQDYAKAKPAPVKKKPMASRADLRKLTEGF